ncbi:MAG: phosphoribosylformylglycinamidine synthase [Bacteroidales bacterium]|nr:phosphoribosylformylglycinamidine synthase [Bacteroidales bacterium]
MIYFYSNDQQDYYLVHTEEHLSQLDHRKLSWLFGDVRLCMTEEVEGWFIGPRQEMITPWSTNAVEITQNMGIRAIDRIESFERTEKSKAHYDPMLQQLYHNLDQEAFKIRRPVDPIRSIDEVNKYNEEESLALSKDEVQYLEEVSKNIGRKLTDSEVYGFAQINSEHCRHKIFNGSFVIDGKEMKDSLFALIKKTSKAHPEFLVSAYKDNVAFLVGPVIEQFAPKSGDKASFFEVKQVESVLSIKAETHNFPTTVEPFNGAATGSGGEIRDRMAGGKGSIPLAGTAVYMTSYPRLDSSRDWENKVPARKWLYQSPSDILIKASNGASDFGNKFGQPLINGSLYTFEHEENGVTFAFDKVIMQAGGVGYGLKVDAQKDVPEEGDLIVVLGGDNYRIGMGGGAVSSVATGHYSQGAELNAVQRSNPEMQKRVSNAIRAMVESPKNPIVSIHDHGAGGHLNSLSELVEDVGAVIEINKLPLGDPTLSFKEILGNESQERMGLIVKKKDIEEVENIAARERAPIYKVGEVRKGNTFLVRTEDNQHPLNLKMEYLFGKPPVTVLEDYAEQRTFSEPKYTIFHLENYLMSVLRLEAVACKDWLTNKVDRSVTGKVALQQTTGVLQLPLNNLGVMALDYRGEKGMATALGHAPAATLSDAANGSRLAIVESLTNLVWAPLSHGLSGVALSANWMWPARNAGENARLYQAVQAVSNFSIELGVPIPTGKDSLSMTQKYNDGSVVYAPGTVIITAVSGVDEVKKVIKPNLQPVAESVLIYIPFTDSAFELGGSSFAQVRNKVGSKAPQVNDAAWVKRAFCGVQTLIKQNQVLSGHDVSSGGLITTLLEMNFPNVEYGMEVNLDDLGSEDIIRIFFSEKPAVVLQVGNIDETKLLLEKNDVSYTLLGKVTESHHLSVEYQDQKHIFDINHYRDIWFETSYLLDRKQTSGNNAYDRYKNYKKQDLQFHFGRSFSGLKSSYGIDIRKDLKRPKAAIIREKGVNGDREMAYALYLAGFDVKDVHMTDLIGGKEDLSDVGFIVFVGGFSNSDVLGSAKGWAGAFLYNNKAKSALDNFYKRQDTLSLGICNGCQLMVELNLIYPEHPEPVEMELNDSLKFESGFINVNIHENNSVMLHSLAGNRLGVWVAHGEGKFSFPYYKDKYHIPSSYSYELYPGNPNGSDWSAAAICSNNGRHLAMMPHLERSVFPWQWAHYPENRSADEVTPWIEAFVNSRKWLQQFIS